MEKIIAYNNGINPTVTGLYIVDRGDKLGTPFRWYNAEQDFWGRCEYMLEDALNATDKSSALGFLPWRGPVKVARPVETAVALVNTTTPAPVTTKPVKTKAVKVAKVTKAPRAPKANKVIHPDGSIVWRADRNKYMAWFGGKSEAARPTIDAAKSFLTKKYNVTEFNIIDKE